MAAPNSRDTLIDYCKRRLGEPVIEVNVDPDQLEDRLDDAIALYQEYHSDATNRTYLKHVLTADDITNKYIPISNNVIYVSKLLPFGSSALGGTGMFSIKYQMHLNGFADLQNFGGDMAYYHQMQMYMSTLDMQLNGTPIVNFQRRMNRLYLYGNIEDKDISEGNTIIAEVYATVDPDTHTSIYNDMFMKDYTTALIKQQWGANLIKFEGMQLPGGVMLNGRQIYDDATADIAQLRENLRLEQELPPDFFIG
jgi:hypothetical protein|tara:strand:+ start:1861 stop:2616 length:756 start_codon:yes stop_codon:yes gene_type:complete